MIVQEKIVESKHQKKQIAEVCFLIVVIFQIISFCGLTREAIQSGEEFPFSFGQGEEKLPQWEIKITSDCYEPW